MLPHTRSGDPNATPEIFHCTSCTMSNEVLDDLLAIEVDADDYAETAAGDAPTVPRTFQSEADFEAQRVAYKAIISDGSNYEALLHTLPRLQQSYDPGGTIQAAQRSSKDDTKVKLSKKDVQLLGYAVGELYHDQDFAKIIELCHKVEAMYEIDRKTRASLEKWSARCMQRSNSSVVKVATP